MRYTWGEPDPSLVKNGTVLCPRCRKRPAILHNIYGVLPCDGCRSPGQKTKKGRSYQVPDRIRKQQEQFYPDFVQPHIYDKASKKLVPNPDFVRFYPDKAKDYYSEGEMRRYFGPRLVERSKEVQRSEVAEKERIRKYKEKMVEYAGSQESGLKKLLGR